MRYSETPGGRAGTDQVNARDETGERYCGVAVLVIGGSTWPVTGEARRRDAGAA